MHYCSIFLQDYKLSYLPIQAFAPSQPQAEQGQQQGEGGKNHFLEGIKRGQVAQGIHQEKGEHGPERNPDKKGADRRLQQPCFQADDAHHHQVDKDRRRLKFQHLLLGL